MNSRLPYPGWPYRYEEMPILDKMEYIIWLKENRPEEYRQRIEHDAQWIADRFEAGAITVLILLLLISL
jgi:hypothetical protein